jgi:2-polyprenyl-3-methyl-5-hydroxy-6-metoxy-1,4-benzoquinol methylase
MSNLARARACLDQKRPRKALEILDGLNEEESHNPEFHFLYGLASGWSGDFDRGIEHLNRAIASGAAPFWALFNRGTFEFRRNNHEKAVSDLLAAIMLNPEREEPRTFLFKTVLPNAPNLPRWLEMLLPAFMETMRASFEKQAVRLARVERQLQEIRRELIGSEDRERDMIMLLLERAGIPQSRVTVETDHPIALESADHRFPRGTHNDNTRHPRFVYACEKLFGRKIKHLDLGCAGGGLVWDFLIAGNESYGIEGSDYSLLNGRAEWRILRDHLFTADIAKPFRVRDTAGREVMLDLITAWEVLEHIPEPDLSALVSNIAAHLLPGGLFAASVALFEDRDPALGVEWHVTLRPQEWWRQLFEARGFRIEEGLFNVSDFPRGSGNPRSQDWDVRADPTLGFHLVCRKPDGGSGR